MGFQLPKFLTEDIAKRAVDTVIAAVFENRQVFNFDVLSKRMGHLVVFVPARVVGTAVDGTMVPYMLHERSIRPELWTTDYAGIARSKVRQLWFDQNIDGATDSMPHLLFPGDTPFWGGVKRHGIAAAFSGVQSHFDQMISGMTVDMIKALARDAWEKSPDKAERKIVLS